MSRFRPQLPPPGNVDQFSPVTAFRDRNRLSFRLYVVNLDYFTPTAVK